MRRPRQRPVDPRQCVHRVEAAGRRGAAQAAAELAGVPAHRRRGIVDRPGAGGGRHPALPPVPRLCRAQLRFAPGGAAGEPDRGQRPRPPGRDERAAGDRRAALRPNLFGLVLADRRAGDGIAALALALGPEPVRRADARAGEVGWFAAPGPNGEHAAHRLARHYLSRLAQALSLQRRRQSGRDRARGRDLRHDARLVARRAGLGLVARAAHAGALRPAAAAPAAHRAGRRPDRQDGSASGRISQGNQASCR